MVRMIHNNYVLSVFHTKVSKSHNIKAIVIKIRRANKHNERCDILASTQRKLKRTGRI